MADFNPKRGNNIEIPNINLPDMGNKGPLVIGVIVLLIWLASGIYIVQPDEKGVVLQFGKFNRITDPGPHWRIPTPFERVLTPRVTVVNRIEIGFRVIDPGPPVRTRDVAQESLMLTGDENIVDINAVIQYKIGDPVDYLFNMKNPDLSVREVGEAILREVVGSRNIDEVLTTKKVDIQNDVREFTQEVLDEYEAGISIVQVQLLEVQPPAEVLASFIDVSSAKEEKNQMINEAQGYENSIIPQTRGKVSEIVNAAEAYTQKKINYSLGDAERFDAIYAEYKKAKDITKMRLYLETLEEILPNIEKIIIDEKNSVNPLMFLNKDKNGVLGPRSETTISSDRRDS